MKFNMVCIKFDQKIKKNLKKPKLLTFEVFKGFSKPKNPRFFSKPFSSPAQMTSLDYTGGTGQLRGRRVAKRRRDGQG